MITTELSRIPSRLSCDRLAANNHRRCVPSQTTLDALALNWIRCFSVRVSSIYLNEAKSIILRVYGLLLKASSTMTSFKSEQESIIRYEADVYASLRRPIWSGFSCENFLNPGKRITPCHECIVCSRRTANVKAVEFRGTHLFSGKGGQRKATRHEPSILTTTLRLCIFERSPSCR